MKLVLITFNQALDSALERLLEEAGVEGFTKWTKVYGKGRSSGPHMGTHVWPKANNVLAVAVEDDTARALVQGVRDLREDMAAQGIKAFVLPCEEVI
ncbi:MAG: PG0541 family transporter-associated protein [Desulfobacteraceae bacterium]